MATSNGGFATAIHIAGAAGDKSRRLPHSKNKKWTAGQSEGKSGHRPEGERWERGGHSRRGSHRGRGRERGGQGHHEGHLTVPGLHEDGMSATEDEGVSGDDAYEEEAEIPSTELTEEEFNNLPDEEYLRRRDEFFRQLTKERERDRVRFIAEGKMQDPNKPLRLEDAITLVGTCMDMCPKFERYRRERESGLDRWELPDLAFSSEVIQEPPLHAATHFESERAIPGTKRVDHSRAVKMYERGSGDKILPSDLRPPPVLKKTLNYLFHDLMAREGLSATHTFIRDRSRSVRNDFTIQLERGPLAIECHDRCARFHILALHVESGKPGFSSTLEEQQLMHTLQSLKEFYEDQRGLYQSPTELEMRVYHRLVHIRDQRERHEVIPDEIKNHPVFQLTTQFRLRVQDKSSPITKTSKLVVDEDAMKIFGQLAAVLREQNNVAMIYLVACILEYLFGKECMDDIESIRGNLSYQNIIDGVSDPTDAFAATNGEAHDGSPSAVTEELTDVEDENESNPPQSVTSNFIVPPPATNGPTPQSAFSNSAFTTAAYPIPTMQTAPAALGGSSTSAFSNLGSIPSAFGSSAGFASSTSAPSTSAFGNLAATSSVFGGVTFGAPANSSTSVFNGVQNTVFGSSSPFGTGVHSAAPVPGATPEVVSEGFRASQPSWPTSSSASGSATLPVASPPKSTQSSTPFLNAFAPSFVPKPPVIPPLSFGPTPEVKSPRAENPSVFASNIFSTSPKEQPAGLVSDIFSIPLGAPQSSPPAPVSAPSQPGGSEREKTQSPPPPEQSHIVERRQTLWDLPGSSSPFPRLKEDNMTFTPPPGGIAEPRTPISPTAPPPLLGKVPTIALPPTPTARWFDPSSQPQDVDTGLSRKRSLLHFPSLPLPTAPVQDVLSPIHLTTPTPGQTATAASGGPSPLFQSHVPPSEPESSTSTTASLPISAPVPIVAPAPLKRTTSGPKPALEIQTNGLTSSASTKGKEKEVEVDPETLAVRFLSTSHLVKRCWRTWRTRREATKAWTEACKRSEQYRDKLHRSQGAALSASVSAPEMIRAQTPKKRRISVPAEVASAQIRRIKRRKSKQFVQPITDEELAQRLQENYEENERRWAQGKFRQAVVDCLKSRLEADEVLSEWCTWLSVNTENENTALWLQKKLDVPESGHWVSENVFSIPAFDKPAVHGSPGLIVFERTPLEDVDDEIERKYRVLDDCARLRDVIGTLPPLEKRRYTPCLLVVNWSETDDGDKAQDLVQMTQKLVRDGTIKHVSYFKVSATATELDRKFVDILAVTPLELEDRLSVIIGWRDVRKLFIAPVESIISDLLDTCWPDDEFDWVRYERVMSSIGEILNSALGAILGLFNDTPSHVSVEIPEDLQQPGIMGRGYATGSFADALSRLLLSSAQELVGTRLDSPRIFERDAVDSAAQSLQRTIKTHTERLRQLAVEKAFRSSLSGPSPKRPASDEDLRFSASPAATKRLRPSPFDDGVTSTDRNEPSTSPPPSTSATDSSEKPIVTVAMLRALTKEMLKNYGT